MRRQGYITIQEWMLELGIGGNDLLAYALVFGFCQDGRSCFQGSYEYIESWLGCNRSTVIRVVARLVEQGLLRKVERYVNGVKFCDLYTLIPEAVQNATTGGKMQPTRWQNATEGGGNLPHHNTIDNASIDIEANSRYDAAPPKSTSFDLFKALKEAGVNAATAHDWLQVRKTKRLANTETGWKETLAEIRKSGHSAELCIRTAVAQGWGSFRAAWLDRLLSDDGTGSARARKPKDGDAMMKMYEQLTGRRHGTAPEEDLPNIDEQ